MMHVRQGDQKEARPTLAGVWLQIIAAAAAVAAVAVSILWMSPEKASVSIVLAMLMAAIAIIDAREMRIPNALSLPAIPLGLVAASPLANQTANDGLPVEHMLGALTGSCGLWLVRWSYRRLRGFDGVGLGDVKLAAGAGAWVGLSALADTLLVACILALVLVTAVRIHGGPHAVSSQTAIPFGTVLAPAIWLVWFTSSLARSA